MIPNFFESPEGATVDKSGNIYVADAVADSIYKFNERGDLLIAFGGMEQKVAGALIGNILLGIFRLASGFDIEAILLKQKASRISKSISLVVKRPFPNSFPEMTSCFGLNLMSAFGSVSTVYVIMMRSPIKISLSEASAVNF